MSYTIITNNPLVQRFLAGDSDAINPNIKVEVKFQGSPAMDILTATRVAIRQGASLTSDPQVGVRTALTRPSAVGGPAKPIAFNPYVSVIVAEQGTVDFGSLKKIDEALELYRKNARLRFLAHSDEAVAQFQTADMDMLVAVLAAL